MTRSILSLILLISLEAYSEVNLSSFCNEVEASKGRNSKELNLPKKLSLGESIEFLLDRSSVVEVTEIVDSQLVPAKRSARQSRLENSTMLFTMGHGIPPSPKELEIFEEVRWENIKMRRNYEALLTSINFEHCVKRAKEIGVSDESLRQYFKLIQSISPIRNKMIESEILNVAKAGARFYQKPSLVKTQSYTEIITAIKKNKSRKIDVVLLFHASHEGTLVDSQSMIVPLYFFEELAKLDQLNSLTIFSCYPEQVFEFYKESLQEFQNIEIPIFFPTNIGLLNGMKQVPVKSFLGFAEKHGSVLKHLSR